MERHPFGQRGQSELGQVIYGEPEKKPEGMPEAAELEKREPRPPRSDSEIAGVLYPERNPDFAQVLDSGEIETVLRNTEGKILHRSFGTDVVGLAKANGPYLYGADLSGLKLGDLEHADIRQRDCRGAMLRSLRYTDARGILVSPDTDLAGSDWFLAKITVEDYENLKQCKNFSKAKNLNRPRSRE
jgi:hypothetical protein